MFQIAPKESIFSTTAEKWCKERTINVFTLKCTNV